MASSDGVSKRKSSSNVYSPILPQEWKLNFSSSDPHPDPNEVGGPIGLGLGVVGHVFDHVSICSVLRYRANQANRHVVKDELCVRCSMKVLNSVYARCLPEDGLGYGPVRSCTVPRLQEYRFALKYVWFRIMKIYHLHLI